MKSEKHIRKVGTIPVTDDKKDQFQIEMKNDSLLLFNKLANIMTILIDHGPSSSVAEQRRINDKIAREILGDQYEDFVKSYESTFGKKWFSYKDEPKSVKKDEIKKEEDKPVEETKVQESKVLKVKINGEELDFQEYAEKYGAKIMERAKKEPPSPGFLIPEPDASAVRAWLEGAKYDKEETKP